MIALVAGKVVVAPSADESIALRAAVSAFMKRKEGAAQQSPAVMGLHRTWMVDKMGGECVILVSY